VPDTEADGEIEVNSGVRCSPKYWTLKKTDPAAAQELIGQGFYPKKCETGWFLFTKEKVNLTLSKTNEDALIGHDDQLFVFQLIKEKNIAPEAFKRFVIDVLGVPGTNKIRKEDLAKVHAWIAEQESRDGVES